MSEISRTELLLELKDVRSGYGDAVVLDNVSVSVAKGTSLAVLGRNGVGKSTLLMTIIGLVATKRGAIVFKGRDVTRMAPNGRAILGIGWVPQERHVFPSLTVEENLTTISRPGRWDLEAVYGLFPRLKERRSNMGNQLSGGEQQMLAIGRTLMINPDILLLDEPLEGLAPIIVEELARAIRRMSVEEGMTMLLVEQHADVALKLTDQAIILERGMIAHRGASADLLADRALLDRYVGLRLDGKKTTSN